MAYHSTPMPDPILSVIVCTRERPDDLRNCLAALARQTAGPLEVIVVDNAPRTDRTRLVAEEAGVRYVLEPRPGLDNARNAGLAAARAELVAYTDDDAVPADDWAAVLLEVLAEPGVAGVAGIMLPAELETEAQQLFERYLGGEAGRRAKERRREFAPPFPAAAAGQVGAGANMALRRDALLAAGPFDPAFDAGTATQSGGDTEMFGRLLDAGFRLVYEPRARIAHRHRRTMEELRTQLFGYGVGVYAYWTHRVLHHGDRQALRFAAETLLRHSLRRVRRAVLRRPDEVPLRLVLAEIAGCFYGPLAYRKARRVAGAPPRPGARLAGAEPAAPAVAAGASSR
jgi:GT2 family glycosyltransferase